MGNLLRHIRLLFCKIQWRIDNKHNFTSMGNLFDVRRVHVGNMTYGRLRVSLFDKDKDVVLRIGNYCSIAGDVHFVCGGEHFLNRILTYPVEKRILGKDEALSKGPITVADDVWIGTGATILSGVHIGEGAVIAAGAVVVKDVPPYAVVGGVPADVIKYRFEPDMISFLKKVNYSSISPDFIRDNVELFTKTLNQDILKQIIDRSTETI